jgi:hypothetical protein
VPVDALGFLLGVGEDGEVELLVELAVDEQQVEGGRLDAGTEVEDVIGFC